MSGHAVAEGWYRDPFGVHEDRWISEGRPTRLVRDGGVETSDEPPGELPQGDLIPIPEPELSSPDDLRRADDPDSVEGDETDLAILDAFAQTRPPV